MKNRYEVLLTLDIRGKEESVKDIIDRVEKTLKTEGAAVEQVQRLEKRDLAYEHNHSFTAYFVNIIFEADPATLEKVRGKLKLDDDVSMQNYLRLPAKKKTAEAAA
jgi:small subunit ribosomal protein S6